MGRLLDEDDVVYWLLKRTEMYDGTGHFVDENVVKKNIESRIAKIPTAQPERKKGEWVGVQTYCDHLNEEAKANGRTERYMPSGMTIGVYCNQCWCRAERRSNFCPDCGADMRGEQE